MPDESTPLLPAPTDTRASRWRAKDCWKQYGLYALLVVLGIGVGTSVTLALDRHHSRDNGPLVPPIYTLPPPTGLPRNPAYLVNGTAAVASEDITCSNMGLEILRKHNGTAADAAVTTTLCIGLLNAFSSGIGGGGFALVSVPKHAPPLLDKRTPKSQVTVVDFRETSPAESHENMYDKLGRAASQVGGLSVGVPGELKGLQAAHELYGRVAWSDLVLPVAEIAEGGWQVSRELARRLRIFGRFMLEDPVWAAVYAPRGQLLVEGDWVFRPTYAKTLKRIAHEGPSVLYEGDIAKDIVNTIQENGGIMTKTDLEGYKAHVYPAIKGTFRGSEVYSADAPASGGVLIGMLQILDPLVSKAHCYTAATTHKVIEAMKFSFGARSELCDPAFVKNATRFADFYNPAWADEKRPLITDKTHNPAYYGLDTSSIEDHGTTHLSIVDQWGGAASVTSTVNLIWGSHIMCPKTGIILNDEQDDFSFPGAPDAFGLPPSPWNFPQPGKRPLSSTAPTIVMRNGEVKAVLGGSGGSRIFPSVAQVLLNLACGDNISEAIERPRVHDQILPAITTLEVGPEGVDDKWLHALEDRGHKIGQFDINVGSSEVQAVVVEKGVVWASSDSRKNGIAAAY